MSPGLLQAWLLAVPLALAAGGAAVADAATPASGPESADTKRHAGSGPAPDGNPERQAYFGDLHVHTMLSFDAYVFGTRAAPDDAYAYAKGEALAHPAGFEMRLDEPLDRSGPGNLNNAVRCSRLA